MLQKICDCCKSNMKINEYYEEGTFGLIINTDDGKELSFNGDLCEECEKRIIQEIKSLLHNYSIFEENNNNEEEEEEEEEEKIMEVEEITKEEEEENTFEIKLIENKQEEEE